MVQFWKVEIKYLIFVFCRRRRIFLTVGLLIFNEKIEQSHCPLLQEHLTKYRKLVPSFGAAVLLIEIAGGRSFTESGISYEGNRKSYCLVRLLETHARRIYGLCTTFERPSY